MFGLNGKLGDIFEGFSGGQLTFSVFVAIFTIVCLWKIFEKAGEKGWAAIVPFYNSYVEFKITWGNGWLFLLVLLMIIPILGWIAYGVIAIITEVKLGKAFGKSGWFIVGIIFLSPIFLGILAFGDDKYQKIQ